MNVAIIKYNAGNICSVVHAFRRIGLSPTVTDNPAVIETADRVVFPGQGEAATTMKHLKETGLDSVIRNLRQPILGICIGQQLLCGHSEEGGTDCLGIFSGTEVKRFREADASHATNSQGRLKVPHMGWNSLHGLTSPLFHGIEEGAYAYFVHSYYVPESACTIATTDYIVPFSAAMRCENFYATQFHPEKSGKVGEQVLRNFIELCHD